MRFEKEPVGVRGTRESSLKSSSSSSGGERSTSGEGESSRLRRSASSEREGADEREGEMMLRWANAAVVLLLGSGIG